MSGSEERRPSDRSDEPSEPSRHGLGELIAERRAKAARVREADAGAFPHAFAGVEPIDSILPAYEHLQAGEETDERHRVAGASPRAAARARPRSSTSSIAPARSSCTPAWTSSARSASSCSRRSTSAI